MKCINCNNEVDLNYCSNCGDAVNLKRINAHYIIHEINHVLHLERGIFYTIKELAVNPGQNVKKYLVENRTRLVKPIIFIIISSLIYSISSSFFHLEDGYMSYSGDKMSATTAIFKWVQGHYGYSNIIMGVFIALWIRLFFRRYQFNIFEILILLCFIMGMGMLILALFAAIEGLTHVKVLQYGAMIVFAYATFAIGQFYDKRKVSSYAKALAAYLIGMITFMIALTVLGWVIDVITK